MLKKMVFFAALFFFCARQIPPSGGPDDKTPPFVSYTVPPLAMVRVPVKSKITITFSEWINRATAEKSVGIFPPPVKGIKVRAYGRRIEIRPVAAFAESTTYHIEINSLLTDLHSNSIGSPFHYFFSTGATIDSGKIEGCIWGVGQKGLQQPKVALFNVGSQTPPDTVLFSPPSYVAQTDSLGLFSFEHIRKGNYCIMAWADLNGNNRFEPDKEPAFGPEEKFFKLDSTLSAVTLYPVQCDTSHLRITTIKPVSGRVLSASWSRAADTSAFSFFHEWRVERADAKSPALSVARYQALPRSPNFFMTLSDTTGLASYRFIYKAPATALRPKSGPMIDTLRFNGVHASDTVRPAALSFAPTGKAALRPPIRIVWSKPVKAGFTGVKMGDTLGDTVVVSVVDGLLLSDTTLLEVNRPLRPDRSYHLVLADTLFKDISGNSPRDTLFGKYTITAVSSENLCNSLSGRALCASNEPRRKWLFLPINGADRYLAGDSAGHFRFDSIPSGKGLIASFLDYNGDGRPTMGSLFPWVRPEPYRVFPDTVEARMRWDIEGIEAPSCDVCPKKPAAVSPPVPDANGRTDKNISPQKVSNISDTTK